ncbi:DUF6074 family protein [Thioclava sp. DLFJ5-1]|uniref:DUF6074 family protein n=1 Tax=Thioclava sp. DLFJ5-1 TaxID=1915314 RepID=UPI0009969001|nr:DUF6074 family protein [Thioclava sp. DLFJ5-1]
MNIVVFPIGRLGNEAQRTADIVRKHLRRMDSRAAKQAYWDILRQKRIALQERGVPNEAIREALGEFNETVRALLPEYNRKRREVAE